MRSLVRSVVTSAMLLGVGVGSLGLAACAGKNGPGVASVDGVAAAANPAPSASVDRDEALRQFAQCMRDNGVDLPDPQPGQRGGFGGAAGISPNDPKVQAALTACRSKLPNGGQPPKLDAAQLEQYRKFAECMRANGVDVPDPNPDGTLQFQRGGPGTFNDPNFGTAITACRDQLTGIFPGGGPGGGPGSGPSGGSTSGSSS